MRRPAPASSLPDLDALLLSSALFRSEVRFSNLFENPAGITPAEEDSYLHPDPNSYPFTASVTLPGGTPSYLSCDCLTHPEPSPCGTYTMHYLECYVPRDEAGDLTAYFSHIDPYSSHNQEAGLFDIYPDLDPDDDDDDDEDV
jgi:hypothetical protein